MKAWNRKKGLINWEREMSIDMQRVGIWTHSQEGLWFDTGICRSMAHFLPVWERGKKFSPSEKDYVYESGRGDERNTKVRYKECLMN